MTAPRRIEDFLGTISKLPTLPGIAMKILEAVKKEDLSLRELGDIIATDPAISCEVLKLINSSFFSLNREVTSVHQAVNLLGMNQIKNVALSFSLVRSFQENTSNRFDFQSFWKGSLIAAITTKLLAQRLCPDFAEDGFFLGLLHNIGMLALNQVMPDQYDLVVQEKMSTQCSWHEAETKIIGFDHALFGHYLVHSWGIPGRFSIPIRYHHAPDSLADDQTYLEICRVLHLASLFEEFFTCQDKPLYLGIIESRAHAYGFTEHLDLDEIVMTIQEQTAEIFPLFDMHINGEQDYVRMIEEARKELIHVSSSFLNSLLEQKRQIEELNAMVTNDRMTGLMNYNAFFEMLEKEIFRSLRYDLSLSLIFADIDHFKTVNDSYGHLAGDHILIRVADCLKTCLRSSDALARYGGEEFAVILPQTDEMGALVVAERMRQNIEHLNPEYDGRRMRVTMSFGVACFSGDLDATKNDLLSRADQAMYQAKEQGRNRCWSFSSHTKQGP